MAQPLPKVRFAILGFGHHAARRLVPAFAASENAELIGIWRRNAQENARIAAEHGVRAFASAEELCASNDVDAVFITSPDAHHLADAKMAFQHGKAVLCEKPLAMNAGQAEEMLRASEAAGVLFGVGQNFRFNHSVEFFAKQISTGRIGRPQHAHAQFTYPANTAPRRWITDGKLACGGPIADVGVHCLDCLRFVLGADIHSVSTVARRASDLRDGGLDGPDGAGPPRSSGEMEAVASLQLEMSPGVMGQVSVSARGAYRTLLEVTGSEGVLVAENCLSVDHPVVVQLGRSGQIVETNEFSNADGYVRMLDAFVAAMRDPAHAETLFTPSGADGVMNQRVLDAAYRSWHSGLREPV